MKRKLTWKAIFLTILGAALLAVAAGFAFTLQSGPIKTSKAVLIATSGGHASAQDAYTDALAQAALIKAAVASGDSSVTHGQWVRVTRGIANALTSGGSVGVEGSEKVVLIEARGNFTATYAHPPHGAPLPTGTEMTLILDPISGQVLDYGLSHTAVDLSSVGAVHRF